MSDGPKMVGVSSDPFAMTADVYGDDAPAMVEAAAPLLADGYTVTLHAYSGPVEAPRVAPEDFRRIK